MDIHEYSFETTGFTILKKTIPQEKVKEALDLIYANWPAGLPWKFPFLHLGRVFWDVFNHPWFKQLSRSFAGEHFRIDHCFGVTSDGAIPQLHGGPQSSQLSCFYLPLNNGQKRALVSQINFGICLQGQTPETGGFCYIPGSHKSTEPRDGHQLFAHLYNRKFDHPSIVVPTLEPGDLIMFTEGMVHGDTGWKNKEENSRRIQLYYRVTPGFVCWRDPDQNKQWLAYAATDYERRLFTAPWTGRYTETDKAMGIDNERRKPTV